MTAAGKYGLALVQLAGIVLSGLLVAITFTNAQAVEDRLQGFAIAKVEEAANIAWTEAEGALANSDRAGRLGALAERFGFEAEATDARREEIVPALLAFALSDRCGDNCGLAALTGLAANTVLVQQAAQLRVGETTVQDFIVERYETSVRGLILDLRRFGMVNVVALSLMLGLVLFRDMLNWRFAALSAAVTGYTAWAAYGYVFNQNWALSILFQDWAAPGYQLGMIVMSCLFFDWLFLRGKVTEFIGNALSSVFSSVG